MFRRLETRKHWQITEYQKVGLAYTILMNEEECIAQLTFSLTNSTSILNRFYNTWEHLRILLSLLRTKPIVIIETSEQFETLQCSLRIVFSTKVSFFLRMIFIFFFLDTKLKRNYCLWCQRCNENVGPRHENQDVRNNIRKSKLVSVPCYFSNDPAKKVPSNICFNKNNR